MNSSSKRIPTLSSIRNASRLAAAGGLLLAGALAHAASGDANSPAAPVASAPIPAAATHQNRFAATPMREDSSTRSDRFTLERAGAPELLVETPAKKEAPISPAAAPPARRTIHMLVTAYCPCPLCCGANAKGITASGKPVTHHHSRFAAADTSRLPFGTQLKVPGYDGGNAIEVIDRGGKIIGDHIDVFFKTHQEARAWGKRWLDVEVIDSK